VTSVYTRDQAKCKSTEDSLRSGTFAMLNGLYNRLREYIAMGRNDIRLPLTVQSIVLLLLQMRVDSNATLTQLLAGNLAANALRNNADVEGLHSELGQHGLVEDARYR
jgi:hypothetical protein